MSLSDTGAFRMLSGGKCPTCQQAISHPVWDFAKFALVCGLLTFLLAMEATNFDITEARVIFGFGVVVAAMKWGGPPVAKQVIGLVGRLVPGK